MRYAAEEGRGCAAVNVCQNCMGTAAWTAAAPDFSCWAVPSDEPASVPCFGPDSFCAVQPYPRLGVETFGKVCPFPPFFLLVCVCWGNGGRG